MCIAQIEKGDTLEIKKVDRGTELADKLLRFVEEFSWEDVKAHMEEIRTYVRGHNLYDIFYGSFREQETELFRRYLELAPREDFADILDAIDSFEYFNSRSV